MRCRFFFVGDTDPVSCCFFIVFRFNLKNYAVNLSFMVIEKNGKLPDTKAAQDTMLDLIFPICETKDRQCMGWGSPCTVIIPESPLRIISRNPRLFNCRCSSQRNIEMREKSCAWWEIHGKKMAMFHVKHQSEKIGRADCFTWNILIKNELRAKYNVPCETSKRKRIWTRKPAYVKNGRWKVLVNVYIERKCSTWNIWEKMHMNKKMVYG